MEKKNIGLANRVSLGSGGFGSYVPDCISVIVGRNRSTALSGPGYYGQTFEKEIHRCSPSSGSTARGNLSQKLGSLSRLMERRLEVCFRTSELYTLQLALGSDIWRLALEIVTPHVQFLRGDSFGLPV